MIGLCGELEQVLRSRPPLTIACWWKSCPERIRRFRSRSGAGGGVDKRRSDFSLPVAIGVAFAAAIHAAMPAKRRWCKVCRGTGKRFFCSNCSKPWTRTTFTNSKCGNATGSWGATCLHCLRAPQYIPQHRSRPCTARRKENKAVPASP